MLPQNVGENAEDHPCTQRVFPLTPQQTNKLPCLCDILLVDDDLTAKKVSRFRVLHVPPHAADAQRC